MQGLKKSDHVEFLDLILSGRSLEIVLQMTVVCHPSVFGKRQDGINPIMPGHEPPFCEFEARVFFRLGFCQKARIAKHRKLAARYPRHGALQKLTQFIEWPFW